MCDICDGSTHHSLDSDIREAIRSRGWVSMAVEPEPGLLGWSYTIGLLHSYDHPELVLVDDDVDRGRSILSSMATAVRDGAVFQPGDPLSLAACRVGLVDVHHAHLQGGLLAMWHSAHRSGGGLLGIELEAYQVVVHDPLPGGDELADVWLDDPGASLRAARGGRGPWPAFPLRA